MDKKRSILNVSVSIFFKIIILVVAILVRRLLIRQLGNDVNGLNSLYISILDFLAVAELGIGTAIAFCMYKPIVDGDNAKVSALYGLFNKMYWIIGSIIAVAGLALMPALPYLAKDYNADVNLQLTFLMALLSVVLTYVFSAKVSLINAYKDNYITTITSSCATLIQYGLQIIVIVFAKSFMWYLICRVISSLIQWAVTEIIARRKHGIIIANKQKIDENTKKQVEKNIRAMFMHKIGTVIVSTADNIIISAFIGVAILGKYSNYTSIIIAMVSVMPLCFSPLTAVLGQMCVEESDKKIHEYFKLFHTFNFILGLVFFLGYYAVIDNLISILFDGNLVMIKAVPFIITVNYFVVFMEQTVRLFKDATGAFYYDRWKCLFEAITNAALSILFVFIFPEEYNVVGVIVATIITNLFICHIVEPYVLYKHLFHEKVSKFYLRNYFYILIFVGLLAAVHFSIIQNDSQWIELFANGGISLAYSLGISAIIIGLNKKFRQRIISLFRNFGRRLKRPTASEEEQQQADEKTIEKPQEED